MSKNLYNKLKESLNSGELLQYVDDSLAARQVLSKLGFSGKGQYAIIVRQFLLDNEIDISHFTPNGKPILQFRRNCPVCNKEFTTLPSEDKVTCSYSCSNTHFRSGVNNPNWIDGAGSYRVRALKYYNNTCNRCGTIDTDVLEVHHIDKDRSNNELDNLVVLCANCHLKIHKNT